MFQIDDKWLYPSIDLIIYRLASIKIVKLNIVAWATFQWQKGTDICFKYFKC